MDLLLGTYNYLDLTPLGRQDGWGGTPDLNEEGQFWVRHHDRYGDDDQERDEYTREVLALRET